jgi:thiol:disulfide interchange protein
MPARDRVTGPAQVVRQILLHLYRRPKRHRVQVRVQFRQEAEAVALDGSGLLSFLTSQPKFCPAMKTRTLSILGTVALLVSGFCSNAFGAETPAATSRPAIYDEKADGAKQIADALAVAKKQNKRVLLQFGANWCGWCHKLHKLCQTDPDIAAKLKESFVVVLVDVNKGHNGDINKKYGNPAGLGLPAIVILDADGKALTTQDSGKLEQGDHHDPKKVLAFLNEWAGKKS